MNRVLEGMSTVVLLATMLGAAGCGKENKEGGSASSAPSSATTTGAKPASTGAKPSAAASNLPVKGPWEAVKITPIDKKDPNDGSPYFKIENLGSKTVNVLFIDFYGYDAKGKQVAHEERSFNLEIKGGGTGETYTKPHKDVATWEAIYHGISFDGDANMTTDNKRAPANRPKGG